MQLVFRNKTNIRIIGFQVTHFGFALALSDIDLWNKDLLDTHLDLLDTDISSKHFVCLQDVLKTSWIQDMSSRCLEDVFRVTIFCLPRRLCKTSSRRLERLKIVTPKMCWRRLQDMSWRPTNVSWVHIWSYSGPHFSRFFPHSHWKRRDTEYLYVFSPNA